MYSFLLQVITELIIILCYAMKIEHYTNKKEKMRIFWAKFLLFFLTVISAFAYALEKYMPLHNIFFILFLSFHK